MCQDTSDKVLDCPYHLLCVLLSNTAPYSKHPFLAPLILFVSQDLNIIIHLLAVIDINISIKELKQDFLIPGRGRRRVMKPVSC